MTAKVEALGSEIHALVAPGYRLVPGVPQALAMSGCEP